MILYCYLSDSLCIVLYLYCYWSNSLCIVLYLYCYWSDSLCIVLHLYCYWSDSLCIVLYLYCYWSDSFFIVLYLYCYWSDSLCIVLYLYCIQSCWQESYWIWLYKKVWLCPPLMYWLGANGRNPVNISTAYVLVLVAETVFHLCLTHLPIHCYVGPGNQLPMLPICGAI